MKPFLLSALLPIFVALLPGCRGNKGSASRDNEDAPPVEAMDSSVAPASSDTLILPRTDTLSESRRVAFPDKRTP